MDWALKSLRGEKNSSFNMIWNCIPLSRTCVKPGWLTKDKNPYLIQSRTKGTHLTQVASCCNGLSHHVNWMKRENFVKHCFHLRSRGTSRCTERWFSALLVRNHHFTVKTTGTVAITWDFIFLSTSPFWCERCCVSLTHSCQKVNKHLHGLTV